MRQRSCQTDLHVARVPRGTRAMPVNEKPRVSRGGWFFVYNSGVTDLKLQRGDTMKVIDLTHTGALLPSVTIPPKKSVKKCILMGDFCMKME